MEKIRGGYYIKARKIMESNIQKKPPIVREIWDWLLMNANFIDKKYNGHIVKRGQLFRTYKEIRDGLSWYVGYRKMTYSEDQTKKAMKALRKLLMIASVKAPGGVLITILNYDKYQDPKNYEGTNESTNESTKQAPSRHQGGTTLYNKKGNNLKNVKNEELETYLQEIIIKHNFILLKDKIYEFYQYRMTTKIKKKNQPYSSTKGLDGLFRSLIGCRDEGLNISDCIDMAMEDQWLKPDPSYFKNKSKPKNICEQNTQTCQEWINEQQ